MDSDDRKITQLTRVTSLSDSDLFVVVVNVGTAPVTKAIEKSNAISGINMIGLKRLSLTSATPVTTTDVTGSTIYWTDGNTNLSVAVPATTVTPFDVFYDAVAGTLSTANWTNDASRATGLVRSNGMYAKSGDITKIYLGTGRTTSVSGQCEDSVTKRFLWNMYNRVDRRLEKTDSTSHTYTTGSWRYWNNDSAQKVEFIIGAGEDAIFVYLNSRLDAGSGETGILSFGIDTTSTSSSGSNAVQSAPSATVNIGGLAAGRSNTPTSGYHYIAAVQFGAASSADYVSYILSVMAKG